MYKYGETYLIGATEMVYLGKDGFSGFFRNKESMFEEVRVMVENAKIQAEFTCKRPTETPEEARNRVDKLRQEMKYEETQT